MKGNLPPGGRVRPPRRFTATNQHAAVAFGIAAFMAAFQALEFWRAYQAYSNVWVQALTGRDPTMFLLLALFLGAGAVLLGVYAWRLWHDDDRFPWPRR